MIVLPDNPYRLGAFIAAMWVVVFSVCTMVADGSDIRGLFEVLLIMAIFIVVVSMAHPTFWYGPEREAAA